MHVFKCFDALDWKMFPFILFLKNRNDDIQEVWEAFSPDK